MMEDILRMVEESLSQVVDEEKLRFFTSKMSIWDDFSILKSIYQSLSVNEKTALFRKYCSNLDARFCGKNPAKSFSLSSED